MVINLLKKIYKIYWKIKFEWSFLIQSTGIGVVVKTVIGKKNAVEFILIYKKILRRNSMKVYCKFLVYTYS